MISLISSAYAADGAPASAGIFNLVLLAGFVVIFYFLMWRPQAKRTKEHKNLIAALAKGTEVVTGGGVLGKVSRVDDNYVVLEVSENIEMKFQKSSVAAVLPKGTLKSI